MLDTVTTTTTRSTSTTTAGKPVTRVPTRWSLSGTRGTGPSDGAWWPQSTNLATELADLDVAVYAALGERIAHATYAKDMWKLGPRKIHSPLGTTKVGWFNHARYPENIDLSLTGFTHLVLTVIPPGTAATFAAIVLGDYGTEPAIRADDAPGGLDTWDNEGGNPPANRTAHYGYLYD
ncbi:MAG TPA: DUF5994 family protein [Flexivirga sp.]|uniref:DUF5994 family protein n=1 Tax=Flexivirga sp. TaxID=1962927 RepID=UPI002C84A506|nr:DUF5994 family protein [Flexivirga sp.]HWC23819.1 DUF5994 family protein [Flexivirga sp.]